MEAEASTYWPSRWRFASAMLAICWILSFLSILSYLIFFFLGFALFRTASRKAWPPLVLLIAANPFSFFFVGGIVDYSKGQPSLRSMGLPGFEFFNPDPRTRCYRRSGGCVIRGNELVWQGFHNLGVRAAANVFGPPSGAYDGPYPLKKQAMQLSANAPDIPLDEFHKGKISVGNRAIQLDPSMIREWGSLFGIYGLVDEMDPLEGYGIHAKAVLVEDRCLILRLIQNESGSADTQDFIVLIDLRNLLPFAYYRIEGSPRYRVPRMRYATRTQ